MKRLFVATVMLQLLVIGAVMIEKETLLRTGQTIRLDLQPRDPRSLLQGDYVILNYPTLRAVGGQGKVRVVLERDPARDIYEYARVAQAGEALEPDEVLLTGFATLRGGVDFGIGQYFIPAGTGLDLERTLRTATLKVSRRGDAMVVSVSAE